MKDVHYKELISIKYAAVPSASIDAYRRRLFELVSFSEQGPEYGIDLYNKQRLNETNGFSFRNDYSSMFFISF